MTKADLVTLISSQTSASKTETEAILESFFNVVKDSMSEGHTIYIRGFGTFDNKKRNKRTARNIRANITVEVDEYYYPHFKPSKKFIAQIKDNLK
jgi:DNA-binding protein HU-beta